MAIIVPTPVWRWDPGGGKRTIIEIKYIELTCPKCKEHDFYVSEYASAYRTLTVDGNADPATSWLSRYDVSDADISDDWSADGNEWFCSHCHEVPDGDISSALDTYLMLIEMHPGDASTLILNWLQQLSEQEEEQ